LMDVEQALRGSTRIHLRRQPEGPVEEDRPAILDPNTGDAQALADQIAGIVWMGRWFHFPDLAHVPRIVMEICDLMSPKWAGFHRGAAGLGST
ncbi:MAG: hypothetical protein AAFR17_18655, partial [Pseudomonadota bacterium]